MTIKNFAFFGIMASILGISAANADSPTAKRIASTHYVDEAVAPKQDKLDTTPNTGNVTFSGEGNAITGVSASGDGTVQFTKGATFLTATDITGKQDKISNATNGNITTTDASGQTQDSGKTFTTTVDSNSTNAQIPTAAAVQSAITTATADVSGKVDIVQGQPNANHIVITDASGNVTTAATIPNTQVSGLGTAATRDAGAFQAYADSTVGSGTYDVISDGNQVGKNLIKLDDGKQNKSDSRVPNSDQYAVIQPGLNVGTNLVALDAEVRNLNNDLSNRQLASASAVPTLQEGSYNAITSGNNVGTNLVALDTAIGTLSGTAGSALQGVATTTGSGEAVTAVTEDSNHNLQATKSKLTYAGAMSNDTLPEINGTANWTTANCTDDDPCVLTMKSNGVFVWTHMVTQ